MINDPEVQEAIGLSQDVSIYGPRGIDDWLRSVLKPYVGQDFTLTFSKNLSSRAFIPGEYYPAKIQFDDSSNLIYFIFEGNKFHIPHWLDDGEYVTVNRMNKTIRLDYFNE